MRVTISISNSQFKTGNVKLAAWVVNFGRAIVYCLPRARASDIEANLRVLTSCREKQ